MTDPAAPNSTTDLPRQRGRLGQWSDRVKALLLLSLLAVAGAMTGLGGAGGEAERARDGLSAGGSDLRAALSDNVIALSQDGRQQAGPDHVDGGIGPAPKALAGTVALPERPVAAILVAFAVPADTFPHPRAGRAARMPTGPPAGLSV